MSQAPTGAPPRPARPARARIRRVAIVTPVLHASDAVGIDTIEMSHALESCGIETAIFAETVRGLPIRTKATRRATSFAVRDDDALVYHFSYGWPGALPLLDRARCIRIVKYHNVTPPAFFEPYSPAFTAACREGRNAIKALVGLGCERYLADSRYNLDELLAAGLPVERGGVVPPFNRIEHLSARPADLAFLDRHGFDTATQLLMVGRMAPNKGHFALLDAFATYRARFDAGARLLVVGKRDARLSRYGEEVESRAARLGVLPAVTFLEELDEPELKAAYLSADAFVIASEHEGFCVPLAEAMAFGVPVVCGSGTAMPETVGAAGLVIDAGNPAMFADAINRVVTDAPLRGAMRRLGRERFTACYGTEAVSQRLIAEIELAA